MTESRESKLPRWAQNELKILRQDLATSEARLENALAGMLGPADSNTRMHLTALGQQIPLENSAQVEFLVRDDGGHPNRIRVRIERHIGADLIVQGDDLISVQPHAGNSVRISTAQRRTA